MKNLFKSLLAVVMLTSLVGCSNDTAFAELVEAKDFENNNVGNGETYVYEITDINETEIHGIPLTKASDGNRGIFLYKDEVDFEVELGDVIYVVWGEEEDEFASIIKEDK